MTQIRKIVSRQYWQIILTFGVLIGLIAAVSFDLQTEGKIFVWQVYLLPVALAGIVLEVWGGLAAGFIAGFLLYFISPATKTLRLEILAGWCFGFIFWGGLIGYLKRQSRMLKETNEQLKKQQQLQTMFIDFLVHDLRAPLTSVIGGLESLASFAKERLMDEDQELLTISISGANRLLTMINSFLDLRKLEEGKFPLSIKEFDPKEIVKEAVWQVQMLAHQQAVNLEDNVPEGLPHLTADRWVLIRVLVNLISNTLRYTPSGKTITVQAFPEGEHLHFVVTSKGSVLPKEYIDLIFDRFAQVDLQKSRKVMWSGVGLTFCKLAVEAHNGRIWLRRDSDKGTTIHFVVPLKLKQV